MAITMCTEMKRLRKMLDERKIEWYDDSTYSATFWMIRTKFEYKGYDFSVINGYGSYGGYYNGKNEGKLELMIDACEPIGHLTAKQVIQRLDEYDG